jgi:hypothetical protein
VNGDLRSLANTEWRSFSKKLKVGPIGRILDSIVMMLMFMFVSSMMARRGQKKGH